MLCVQESLDEVTVKDMLEGDNMYTCSKCQKKVRAEKRYAAFTLYPLVHCGVVAASLNLFRPLDDLSPSKVIFCHNLYLSAAHP